MWRRILATAPARLAIELAALIAVELLVALALKPLPAAMRPAAGVLVGVPALVAAYGLLVRTLERRPVTELAPGGALRELGVGLLLGAALFSLTIGVIALAGGYVVTEVGSPLALVPPLTMAVASGVTEEILARGVVFRLLEEWLGTWMALAISAALFGLAHVANPHATPASAAAIAAEAGVLLATAYMLTRRLWLAIGLHAAWNWTQGAVFGVAVSGVQIRGWLHGELRGPDWLSGGAFGAEASLVAVAVGCGAAVVLLVRSIRTHGIKRFRLRGGPP
jgi:membrane protease YdiL (CAAX protease family)